MESPLLSIIVPVYNVAPYLEECLDSVLAQTFLDYEVLLVDDGSTDESGEICDRYATTDPRFRVIHKTNGGVSSARNAALDICRGKYLTMLDPDDTVAPDTYENTYYLEKHPEIGILQFPYVNCYENGRQEMLKVPARLICGKEQILWNWWEGNIVHFAHLNKIFRRQIFENLHYRTGHVSEDTYLTADFVERAEAIYISEQGRYFYRIRTGSLTSSYTFEKHIDLFEAHLRTYELIHIFPFLRTVRVRAFTRLFRRLISAQLSAPGTDLRPYFHRLRPYIPRWRDIFLQPTFWMISVKILGLSRFTKLFCFYLRHKGN